MMTHQLFSLANIAEQSVLWILALGSILSFSIILERSFFLRALNKESENLLNSVENSLATNKLEILEDFAKLENSLLGKACLNALTHLKNTGLDGFQEVFNTYTLIVRAKLERSLEYLGTIGSNAPYVGLLGTVLGIMKTFHDMSLAQTETGQKVVMAGISFSLIATAAGLIVAIPSVIFFNFFHKKVQKILDALNVISELGLAYAKKNQNKSMVEK